jgi:hypothetical protein
MQKSRYRNGVACDVPSHGAGGVKRLPWLASSLVLVAVGCGGRDLPNEQVLSSEHFRYHARADTAVDPTIVQRLEARRNELARYLDVEGGVIDYYRFRDVADRRASTGCNAECTDGRSIFAVTPFQEHELVHALLADVNETAPVLAEGAAQYFACMWPRMAAATPPKEWPKIGSASIFRNDHPDVVYGFGQRLVSWMSQMGGTSKLVDFYRDTLQTSDAAVFAVQFQRAWNRRLGDVAGELPDQRFAGSFCPCTAPQVPADGSPTSLVAGQDYRTLEVAQESRLELTNDGLWPAFPFACVNAIVDGPRDELPSVAPGVSGALTVARIGPGHYGVTSPSISGETVTLSQTQQPMSDWTCEAAAVHPIPLGQRQITVWVTAEFADQETWFALDNVDRMAAIDILSPATNFAICPSCAIGDQCFFGFNVGMGPATEIPVASPAGKLFVFMQRRLNQPAANLGLRVRPWR